MKLMVVLLSITNFSQFAICSTLTKLPDKPVDKHRDIMEVVSFEKTTI